MSAKKIEYRIALTKTEIPWVVYSLGVSRKP